MILHIFDVEGDDSSLCQPFDGEMEPRPVLIFDVVDSNPDIVLNRGHHTLVLLIFSAL